MDMLWTILAMWAGWAVAVASARLFRGRVFAIMTAVVVGMMMLIWTGLLPSIQSSFQPVACALMVASLVHVGFLTRPRLRPVWFRALISIPGLWFAAATLLALPWAIVAAIGFTPHGWWLPFVLGLGGVVQSLRNRREDVDLVVNGNHAGPLARTATGVAKPERPLTIVQITDPHIGPFMSTARMRRICQRAVDRDPDLILITGDLMTMESNHDVDAVTHALEPLAAMAERVFVCFGNHDHEARQTVREAIQRIGATLLVDDEAWLETRAGPVQIIGADFVWGDRQSHLAQLFERVSPRRDRPRILMLHDPGAFKYVPDGQADLALSGHWHGGQVGLVSLGLSWTVVSGVFGVPDHGFWALGHNRMYVHRGTGHYGFPIRFGVPGEEGLLKIWFE